MSALTFRTSAAALRPARRHAVLSLLRLWLGRLRTRRELAALHPDQIRDAGIDPRRLRAESLKPFWRA